MISALTFVICMQLLIGFVMVRAIRRQRKFHGHLVKARRFQVVALELFTSGDPDGGGLHLAASQEELDRAQYYS